MIEYVQIAFMLIGVMAAVAALTPNKSDDKFVQTLLDFINLSGLNVGKAKNKEE